MGDKKIQRAKDDVVPRERIESKILLIRGKKVMLDVHLAALYGVTTGALMQAVNRNKLRFPVDFMYQITRHELAALKSQNVISNTGRGGLRKLPHVFTEQGVAMLSSVLNSKRAILVNIQIMRTFTKLRELMVTHKDLKRKVEALERKYREHDQKFQLVFEAIKQLLEPGPDKKKQPIGFHAK